MGHLGYTVQVVTLIAPDRVVFGGMTLRLTPSSAAGSPLLQLVAPGTSFLNC